MLGQHMNDIEWTKDSTLTAQGQTTIPKFVREHLGLEPGDSIRFFPMDDHVQMMRVGSVKELIGMVGSNASETVSIEEINEITAKGWAGELSEDDNEENEAE